MVTAAPNTQRSQCNLAGSSFFLFFWGGQKRFEEGGVRYLACERSQVCATMHACYCTSGSPTASEIRWGERRVGGGGRLHELWQQSGWPKPHLPAPVFVGIVGEETREEGGVLKPQLLLREQ